MALKRAVYGFVCEVVKGKLHFLAAAFFLGVLAFFAGLAAFGLAALGLAALGLAAAAFLGVLAFLGLAAFFSPAGFLAAFLGDFLAFFSPKKY